MSNPFQRGRGGRGRGFTLSPGATNLDRRPSRILVSGYELEEKEEMVLHFAKFGEILEQVEDEVRIILVLYFLCAFHLQSPLPSGDSFDHPEVQDSQVRRDCHGHWQTLQGQDVSARLHT